MPSDKNYDNPAPKHIGPKDDVHERVTDVIKDLLGGNIVAPARKGLRDALDGADRKQQPQENKDNAIGRALGAGTRAKGDLPLFDSNYVCKVDGEYYHAVSLDGYIVRMVTEKEFAISKRRSHPGPATPDDAYIWIPRSATQDADSISVGDTDLIVARWLAEREGLDF